MVSMTEMPKLCDIPPTYDNDDVVRLTELSVAAAQRETELLEGICAKSIRLEQLVVENAELDGATRAAALRETKLLKELLTKSTRLEQLAVENAELKGMVCMVKRNYDDKAMAYSTLKTTNDIFVKHIAGNGMNATYTTRPTTYTIASYTIPL
jgi:hypothetical protein